MRQAIVTLKKGEGRLLKSGSFEKKREKRQREGYEAQKARGEWDKLGRPVK